MALTKEEIERVFEEHPWLQAPNYIYVLTAPLVYPEKLSEHHARIAMVHGLTPVQNGDKAPIILSETATTETVIHETLHAQGAGEIITYPLSRGIQRFRRRFPAILRKKVKYREFTISSSALEKYGILMYPKQEGIIKLFEKNNG